MTSELQFVQVASWSLASRPAFAEIDFVISIIDNLLTNQVSIEEIKRDLPTFLQRVRAGETIIITLAGEPMAEIRPIVPDACKLRPLGLCEHEFVVPDSFDDPLPEGILREFEKQ